MKKIPATEENVAKMKKGNVPFSRIPKDTVVDERFKSNEYVSYEYADKAYQDLVVTKVCPPPPSALPPAWGCERP